MKKYRYLLLIILLILSGYYIYRQYTQNKNWSYFFEDSERNLFEVLSISDALFHYEFYTKLSAPFSTKDIVKYSPCLVQDEILKLNKKHHLVPQNKLENTFNTNVKNMLIYTITPPIIGLVFGCVIQKKIANISYCN